MAINILDRIANETELTKSERKLASIILKNPASVINENIAQLAKRAGVSEPSVFRFCKRFGAEGFPAFKLVLSSLVSSQNLKKIESVKQGDTVGDIASKVIDGAKVSVSATERNVDESMLARVIDVVSQSHRIVVLSQGLSSFIAVDFVTRMLNLGFACESYTDRNSMLLALSTLRLGDVVIAFSSTGCNRDILDMAELIKSNSACLVGVCPDDSKLSDKADLILKSSDTVDITNDSVFSNRLSLLLLSQMIIGGVMLRRGIAISDLKDKVVHARKKAYAYEIAPEDEEPPVQEEVDDGSIKPGAPITTLDWRY